MARMTLFRCQSVGVVNFEASEDIPIWLGDVVENEIANLTLDVGRLISDWNLGESRKVDESEIEDVRRVNFCCDCYQWLCIMMI